MSAPSVDRPGRVGPAHVGAAVAGAGRVDEDAAAAERQLVGQVAGQRVETRLGDAVGGEAAGRARPGHAPETRRQVDHATPPALRHPRHQRRDQREGGVEVDGAHVAPLVQRRVEGLRALRAHHRGGVDQHVDLEPVDARGDPVDVGEVVRQCLTAERRHGLGERVGVARHPDHAGAGGRQPGGDRAPEPPARAGDERAPSGQVSVTRRWFPAIRSSTRHACRVQLATATDRQRRTMGRRPTCPKVQDGHRRRGRDHRVPLSP